MNRIPRQPRAGLLAVRKELSKIAVLVIALMSLTGCVSFDRMLNPLTNQTKHYTFNYQEVSNGGLMVAAVVDKHAPLDIEESIENTIQALWQFEREREEFSFRTTQDLVNVSVFDGNSLVSSEVGFNLPQAISGQDYQNMIEQYKAERWVAPELLAVIRDAVTERFVMFARIDDTDEYQSSNCWVRDEYKKYRKRQEEAANESSEEEGGDDKDSGEEYDESEEPPYKYAISRASYRSAVISIDVFDLAQDIIVWSATRSNSLSNTEYYKSDYSVSSYDYLGEFPFPNFPSWARTYSDTFHGFAVHLPHKSD